MNYILVNWFLISFYINLRFMGFFQKKLTVTAPAKVNLHLEVLDRLQSGFHSLESIFLALDFGDILHFELVKCQETTEIAIKGLDTAIPIEENTVFCALRLFREKTGFSKGLKIMVEKRVPAGGGLGGGSSDAAAVLLALNRLAGFPLNRAALLETAAALGSDVPFFIYRTSAARVTGRGETIEPFDAPRLFFVIVNPGFPSDTATAYRLLDEYRAGLKIHHAEARRDGGRGGGEEGRREENEKLEKEIFSDPARWSFRNDFLPVFGEKERSAYNEIICKLRELGAGFAGLSGSGSTCFGVFTESGAARRAADTLRGMWNFVEYCGLWNGGE
jgi:4-diphosphocytidyl-2-C-methyl-D-erythritol kinase